MGGWGSIRANTLYSLRQQLEKMTRIGEQVSSGASIIRASDQPSGAYRLMTLRSERMQLTTYRDNLQTVSFNMQQIGNVLQEVSTSLSRVKELGTQAASGTYSPANRVAAGQEVNSILEDATSSAAPSWTVPATRWKNARTA